MNKKMSERRLAENQVLFRQKNEQVASDLEALKKAAESEGRGSLVPDSDVPLHFYCECSNTDCRQRIILTTSQYKELHQNSSQFILVTGHEVPNIERVVFRNDKYEVVEKFQTPPPAPKRKIT